MQIIQSLMYGLGKIIMLQNEAQNTEQAYYVFKALTQTLLDCN